MTARACFFVASTALLALSNPAHASCSSPLTEQFAGVQRIVDSLRSDKPGQARVFASDGSEYTAGEAAWMKGLLHAAQQACARGDEASAASAVDAVRDLLNSRHHAP